MPSLISALLTLAGSDISRFPLVISADGVLGVYSVTLYMLLLRSQDHSLVVEDVVTSENSIVAKAIPLRASLGVLS